MVQQQGRGVGQTVRFHETLRRLAMIDEAFVENEARVGLGLARTSALDPKTAALLRVGVSAAIGSPGVCLEWSTGRALAAGASEDEIAEVLLAIARWPGLAGSSAPPPMWRPRSGTTSKPRWRNRTVPDGYRPAGQAKPYPGTHRAARVRFETPGYKITLETRARPANHFPAR
jgi:alkylhydroperoxidase/carboxymuconolactone decarboxylase family protein YurZ